MTRFIITISIIFTFLSCQTHIDNKDQADLTVKPNKPSIKKLTRFFSGDSALTLGFKIKIDTAFAFSKNPDYNNFEKISTEKFKDSIIITIRKFMGASLYNGACEKLGDTILLKYWLDTVDCISLENPNILTYKIKQVKYSHVKLKYVDNINAPTYEYCK